MLASMLTVCTLLPLPGQLGATTSRHPDLRLLPACSLARRAAATAASQATVRPGPGGVNAAALLPRAWPPALGPLLLLLARLRQPVLTLLPLRLWRTAIPSLLGRALGGALPLPVLPAFATLPLLGLTVGALGPWQALAAALGPSIGCTLAAVLGQPSCSAPRLGLAARTASAAPLVFGRGLTPAAWLGCAAALLLRLYMLLLGAASAIGFSRLLLRNRLRRSSAAAGMHAARPGHAAAVQAGSGLNGGEAVGCQLSHGRLLGLDC